MKFLHCADAHLDSPLRGLSRYPGCPEGRLRGATREAFERLVQLAIDEAVSFVVIAGDLYDGDRDDFQTAMFLQRRLHELCEAGIPVVIAYGNHDAANEITKRLRFPADVHVFPHAEAAQVPIEEAGVVLHGRSYATRAMLDDLSATYPAPVDGAMNVGVLHTSLDGRPGHNPYAPCTLDGLVHRGYGYWALGHVHRREHIEREGVHVVFPGNLQGRDVGETGSKGATVVEYDGDHVVSVAHHSLAPVLWSRLDLDAGDAVRVDDVLDHMIDQLGSLRGTGGAELHAVRLTVRASAAVANEWLRHGDRYEAQLRADATGGSDDLWVERVEVIPRSAPASLPTGEALRAVRESFAAMRSENGGPERGALIALLGGLRRRFGAAIPEAAGLGAAALDEAGFDQLLDEAEAVLVAELEAGAS